MSRDATAANNVYMPLCYRSDVYYFSNTTSYTQTLAVIGPGQFGYLTGDSQLTKILHLEVNRFAQLGL